MSDLWATISAERGALASDLADLTPAQWDTPSLCPGWTVRDIVAHLSVGRRAPKPESRARCCRCCSP